MMRSRTRVRIAAPPLVLILLLVSASSHSQPLWEMKRLSKPPAALFGERNGLVQEVIYEGEPFNGKPTRIFAYYGRPEGKGPFPGIVLVHGGGGKAFSEWVLHWAMRGYAAIAMDLSGNRPDSGPDQSDTTKFRPFEESDARSMWTYHAVAAVIRANSLLSAQPEVDKNRIGVTGISWGGYLTCIIAGVDHRFKAAVPVYGCGFLDENSAWKERILDKMDPVQRERWVRLFDPSRYLPKVRCPILFLNGTNDFAYPMDSYKKSFDSVRSPKTMSVQIRLPHGHIWTFGIVDAFIDSHLNNGDAIPRLNGMSIKGGVAESAWRSGAKIVKAELYYTSDPGKWQERIWKASPARIQGNRILADLPLARPLVFHLAVTDAAGNIVTTTHGEIPAPTP